MMGNDEGASCASCVMIVMAVTVNCGGNLAAIEDDSAKRLPSPTGPLHRAFRTHVFRPRGTTKPFFFVISAKHFRARANLPTASAIYRLRLKSMRRSHPRRFHYRNLPERQLLHPGRGLLFLIAFSEGTSFSRNPGVRFSPVWASPPQLGLVVRCGAAT